MPIFTTAIRCFIEVARRGSIRRSADYLHLTPSAVNRQILALEEELTTSLFERLPRGVRLTAAGETLLASVRRQERDFQVALSQIAALKGLKRGHVVIASLSHFARIHLTGFIASFRAAFPGITFMALAGTSEEVTRWVADGTAEIGICFEPNRSAPVEKFKTLRVRFGAVMSTQHALASRKKVQVRECLSYPLVLPAGGMESRIFAQQLGLSRWPDHIIAVETNSFSMVVDLIKANVGIGFMPDFDSAVDVGRGEVAFVPLMDAKTPSPLLCVIVKSDRTLPVAAAVVLERLTGHLDQIASETESALART
jgi:DNA-binding transcriptional LysR family regulator